MAESGNLTEVDPIGELSTTAKVVAYEKPELSSKPRVIKALARTDSLMALVQVIRSGGENKLHAHPNTDGFWFVLRGRVRFYTSGEQVVAELGPNEAILTPHDYPYWFESVGAEDLELLQIESYTHPGEKMKRIVYLEDVRPELDSDVTTA
jgi:mannose-6-phosphate isomerase-like protein (cupin superfamily)